MIGQVSSFSFQGFQISCILGWQKELESSDPIIRAIPLQPSHLKALLPNGEGF